MKLIKKEISELNNLVKPVLLFKIIPLYFKCLQINCYIKKSQFSNCYKKIIFGFSFSKMLFKKIVKKEFNDQDNHIMINSLKPHQIAKYFLKLKK
ncbi:unnamed protein product [Paramecium sonneborni]|uniref:Uncharacterized protein n=1 Tax=Paramecium sonneborni TaxID=65129 RepID=A0A8S1KVA9_9CILI|nr:unnamed protein product [Paramecium sonneborni]CAD8057831.1 unnamed protein product [Paramecium sonneborni]